MERANRLDAILITTDKDFGELVFRQARANEGVILLRLYGTQVSEQVTVLLAALENHEGRLHNAFTVIGTTGVRIRRVSY